MHMEVGKGGNDDVAAIVRYFGALILLREYGIDSLHLSVICDKIAVFVNRQFPAVF